jgi:hypothetical protein
MKIIMRAIGAALVLLCGAAAAADSYRIAGLADLEVAGEAADWQAALAFEGFADEHFWQPTVRCRAEAWLGLVAGPDDGWRIRQSLLRLAVKVAGDAPVEGFIDLAAPGGNTRAFAFKLDPAKLPPASEADFLAIKRLHFARLAHHHLPGTAWFQHLAGPAATEPWASRFRPTPELADSFALLSGGRAIAENLALDRDLIVGPAAAGEPVPVAGIQGITVPPIDWSGKLPAGREIAVDPLSLALPLDQHALFAPSLADLFKLMNVIEDEGMPLVQGFTVRNPFRTLATRYRRQLGLDLPDLLAGLLPVKSVAVTGGDPFFPSGTDVAVLFESDDPAALAKALHAAIAARARAAGATSADCGGDGYECTAFTTPDRAFSARLLHAGGLVAVTNSPAQVARLLAVRGGSAKALGASDEFRFFRDRYPHGGGETAYLFLSDETIRRWCGPATRIGASRRARATAALLALSALSAEGQESAGEFSDLLGKTGLAGGRATSGHFGTLGFLTPVAELDLAAATQAEAAAYAQWRRGYESGWGQAFDPIAARLDLGTGSRAIDFTVMPLTVDSDYTQISALAGAARLSEAARAVPAEAGLFLSMAVDRESELFRNFDVRMVEMLPELKVNPLGWMGQSLTLWLDEGLDLEMLAGESEFESLVMLPLVLRIESASSLKLAMFLTGVKSSINSSSPGLLNWENRKHGEQGYLQVRGDEAEGADFAIYYAPLKGALLVSLDESALKRAIDRELAGLPEGLAEKLPPARHLLAESTPAALQALLGLLDRAGLARRLQNESWKALPALNEWHRRQPAGDPLHLHRQHFAEDLACPGGKGYRWNEAAMTMESVVFGHPGEARGENSLEPLLGRFAALRAAMDFEDGGLRVRASAGPAAARRPPVLVPGERLGTAADFTILDPRRRFLYESTSPDGSKTQVSMRVVKVDRLDAVIEFSIEGKDDDSTTTNRSRLAGDLRLLDSGPGEFGSHFPEGILELPAELVAGAVHHDLAEGVETREGKQLPGKRKTRIRVAGRETIEVPAGVFADCVRIEHQSRTFCEGRWEPVFAHVRWLHPKVGMVKSEFRFGGSTFGIVLTGEEAAGD